MPHYLHQVAYSREGWEALLAHPQNRIESVRPAIEKLGGKIETAWFAFGEYDVKMCIRDRCQSTPRAAYIIGFQNCVGVKIALQAQVVLVAVSYTHLDVYKRQTAGSVGYRLSIRSFPRIKGAILCRFDL